MTNTATAAAITTGTVAPAQVGKGRTVHYVNVEEYNMDTLCGLEVERTLTGAEALKMAKECKRCVKTLAVTVDAETPEAPAPVEEAPAAQVTEEPVVEEAPQVEEPAVEEDAPQVDDNQPAAAEVVQAEEPAQVEDAPEVDDVRPADGEPVRVTAYTAAVEALHANGQDNDDRVLTLDAGAVLETVTKMRRMPRWNAAQARFTVNKVAVIVARDSAGERVWVRGEAAPIRVDFTGTPIQEDAPAEAGAVDMAAVLAATRVLRRRKEVQRVIDNRTAARNWNTPAAATVEETAPAPVVQEAPAPVVEEPAPTVEEIPVPVEEAPAPVVEEPTPAAGPEWRTLKGMEAPFLLYGEDTADGFAPANNRKQCTGEPLLITRSWTETGTRYAEDATGRKCHLWGTATKYWVAPTA
ncbi:hypothetical protein [Streptomyces sp. H27-H5]|uniref:hypothetical protein n=1 Tax=Streptomyces sp. H27-H5 TaxID=2996460 RepID=UPI00226E46E7|nr:hypothetical protein [Streptomyces sp. H27-H5]MCY0957702.1 hypothetical protein [Streptomyces sp. H27-H5]